MKLKNPFSSLRRWSSRHHGSLSSFTTNFIATVLGIVLTFGTTMWYEHVQNKKAADALVERCLSDMEARLKVVDLLVQNYDRHDSLYALLYSQPLDSIEEYTLGSLIYEFTTAYSPIMQHAYENSFSQSVASQDLLDQYAVVISVGFEYLQKAEQHHEQINELQLELLRRQILARNTEWDKGSVREVVTETLSDPYFKFYQQQFMSHSAAVRHLHDALSCFIPQARRLWKEEISTEEFWKINNERWGEWHVK